MLRACSTSVLRSLDEEIRMTSLRKDEETVSVLRLCRLREQIMAAANDTVASDPDLAAALARDGHDGGARGHAFLEIGPTRRDIGEAGGF